MSAIAMEVRPGYKPSKAGVIPEDWQEARLSDVVQIVGGGTPNTQVAEYWNGSISWVSAGDVSQAQGRYVASTEKTITEIGLASCPARVLPEGTVVIIARGATVGRMAQLGGPMAFNQTCYGLVPARDLLDQDYLYYAMMKSISSMASLTYGTIFGTITTSSFESWYIPLPPLPEQRAIAAALGDVDALLAALERLIAKRRAVKQAAMDALLSGWVRLPGFTKKWQTTRLGDLLDFERPDRYIVRSTDYLESGIPVLTANKSFILGYTDEDFGVYTDVPVIIFDDFTTDSKYADFPFKVKSSAIKILKTRSAAVSLRFVYEQMQLIRFPVGDHKRYYISEYQHLEVPVPDEAEQRAIAEVLSDMDAALAALERQRAKVQALKQGMMAELLTGRVRLVK